MVKKLPAMGETWDPWVGKIAWKRELLPTPVFLPGEFHGQRSMVGNGPWDPKGLDITERLILFTLVLNRPGVEVFENSSFGK